MRRLIAGKQISPITTQTTARHTFTRHNGNPHLESRVLGTGAGSHRVHSWVVGFQH